MNKGWYNETTDHLFRLVPVDYAQHDMYGVRSEQDHKRRPISKCVDQNLVQVLMNAHVVYFAVE